MELKKVFETRSSIREYNRTPIPRKTIKRIIAGSKYAPSGKNIQPTKYIIIDNKETKHNLEKEHVFPQKWVTNAPTIIVFYGDKKKYENNNWEPQRKKQKKFPTDQEIKKDYLQNPKERLIRDIAINSTYITLKATELGYGTCFIGLLNRKKLKQILKIPKEKTVPFCMTIGKTKEN